MKKIIKEAFGETISRDKIVNLKVTEEEHKIMRELAEKYYNGNLSGWIRYTASRYNPKSSELRSFPG